jgi:hypothetical protein
MFTTDTHYYEAVVAAEGAEFRGIQFGPRGALILFADPNLGSTLAVSEAEFSREAVAHRLEDSRRAFNCKGDRQRVRWKLADELAPHVRSANDRK